MDNNQQSGGQPGMNYPAASCGVSSSVLARHSVLDTESSRALWIPASSGMTNSRQAAGNEPPVDSIAGPLMRGGLDEPHAMGNAHAVLPLHGEARVTAMPPTPRRRSSIVLVTKKWPDKREVGATRMSMLGVGSGPPERPLARAGPGSRETERPFGALLAPEGRWTFIGGHCMPSA